MSKVTIKQWIAPIADDDKKAASKLIGKSEDEEFEVNLLEQNFPIMQGTEADNPLIVNPLTPKGSVTLSPHPRPNASNYFYKNKAAWVARFVDGTIEKQFGEFGVENSVDNLPRAGLRNITLVDSEGKSFVAMDYEPGDMFFYRRRTAMKPGHDVVEVIHILGKTLSEDGPNEIIFLYESDLHSELGDFQQVDSKRPDEWRYPIAWHEADLIPIS